MLESTRILLSTIELIKSIDQLAESGKIFVSKENCAPVSGSILYCKLLNCAEHSGIYIGDNKIVHFEGTGHVSAVSPEEFMARLQGLNNAKEIWVASTSHGALGHDQIATEALKYVGQQLDYHLFNNNCHSFVLRCLTNNNKRNCSTFIHLNIQIALHFKTLFNWRKTSLLDPLLVK